MFCVVAPQCTQPPCGSPTIAGQLPHQRHDRVPGAGKPLVDPRPIQQFQPRRPGDRLRGVGWNNAQLRLRPCQRDLDVEPRLPAVLQPVQGPDAGIRNAGRGWQLIAHGRSLPVTGWIAAYPWARQFPSGSLAVKTRLMGGAEGVGAGSAVRLPRLRWLSGWLLSSWSIPSLMAGLILAVVVPLLAFSGFLVLRSAQHEQALMGEAVRERAQAAAATIDYDLSQLRARLFILAGARSLQTGDLAGLPCVRKQLRP